MEGDYLSAHHGQRFVMPNGDVLVMNTDYPRPAFDVTDKNGEYQGHLYPYHVAEEYGRPRCCGRFSAEFGSCLLPEGHCGSHGTAELG